MNASPATALETRCLDSFPAWLRTLGDDARALAALLETQDSGAIRDGVARGLLYLVKSVDLIQDGLEELGYLDDALVLRVAAQAIEASERAADSSGLVERLASEAALVQDFLGEDAQRLTRFVAGLGNLSARGQNLELVLNDDGARASLAREVRSWAEHYAVPHFTRDAKNLVKVRAFLKSKLPA